MKAILKTTLNTLKLSTEHHRSNILKCLTIVMLTVQMLFVTNALANLPYPIVFIHGLASDCDTWETAINEIRNYAQLEEALVFHVCLNHDESDESAWFERDENGGGDVVPVGWTVFGSNILLNGFVPNGYSDTRLFAINFDDDEIEEIRNGNEEQVHGDHHHSNQAAIYKQGFALKLMINNVLNITGASKVILVGHSMGGLAIREYLQRTDNGALNGNHTWWVNADEENGHRVAKVVTLGTPHLGFNWEDFGGRQQRRDDTWIESDFRGEALRDMHYDYEAINGLYLFGGDEQILDEINIFNNVDVNCNGELDNWIDGINQSGEGDNPWRGTTFNPQMPLPSFVEYVWAVFDLGDGTDGVVITSHQYLYTDDTNEPDGFAKRIIGDRHHIYETTDISTIMRAIDEPSDPDLAYQIFPGKTYQGFITEPVENNEIDWDCFYFESEVNGVAFAEVDMWSEIRNNSIWSFTIERIIDDEPEIVASIWQDHDPDNGRLSFNVNTGERYYIFYSARPIEGSNEHPYSLHFEEYRPDENDIILQVPDEYGTIQAAIDAAEDGDIVSVEAGTYQENINFNGKNISVIGDPEHPEDVVIDGGGNGSVVRIENGETANALFSGFTVRNGTGSGYAGHGGNLAGGGIRIVGSSPTIRNSVFASNTAYIGGGVFCGEGSHTTFANVMFENNTAGGGGGLGIWFNSDVSVTDCQFVSNHEGFGGMGSAGINIQYDCHASLTRVTFFNNVGSRDGGALIVENSRLDGQFVTFYGNSGGAAGRAGGSIAGLWGDVQVNLVNCIAINNGDRFFGPGDYGTPSISYSNIEGGYEGEGNIDSDPLFLDPDNGDFHLTANSPCIDTGDPDSPEDPDGTRADMGAFYYPHQLNNHVFNVPDEYETIQAAIDAAQDGDMVIVRHGTYQENINFIGKEINLIGDPDNPESVVIDGQQRGSVVTIADENPGAQITGFTISNGTAYQGGGIYTNNSILILMNSIISGNHATAGGGIHGDNNSSISLFDVTIENNSTEYHGGGSAICLNNNSDLTWENGTISGNFAAECGFINLEINSTIDLSNLTISENSGDIHYGMVLNNSSASVRNSIIYGNSPDESFYVNASNLTITYSDIGGGYEGEGNIDSDPLFLDPDNGDFHLTANSPCIDTGNPDSPEDSDGTRADMGAYYYEGDRKRIVEVGYCDTPVYAHDVAVSGDYAFVVTEEAGLRVIDFSDPTQPREVGNCETPGQANGVEVNGHYAFIADGPSGLLIIDISDPAQPREVGSCDTPERAISVVVSRDYALVTDDGSGLRIIDISDPTQPREVGNCETPGRAQAVAISGNYAFVADWESGLRVIDVSDPAQSIEIGYCDTPRLAMSVAVFGGYAFVADNYNGLRIIDVSDPSQPREVGSYDTPGQVADVAIVGNYALLANNNGNLGLRIIDVSYPSQPREVGSYDTPGHAYSLALSDQYVLMTDYWDGGLRILDISDFVQGINNHVFNVPDEYGTIQAAIDAAEDGDIVMVAEGTYRGEGNRGIHLRDKDIVLMSVSGPENTIIDCENADFGIADFWLCSRACVVDGFTITNSTVGAWGGGCPGAIFIDSGSPTIKNCRLIHNNGGGYAGGVTIGNPGFPLLMKCEISNNQGAGGIWIQAARVEILNCTITGNTYGITCDRNANGVNGNIVITNAIVYANPGGDIRIGNGADDFTVSYSDIGGGRAGTGNINADPLFADPDNGDFHLTANSPCIDTGDPDSPEDPDGTRADMGAFYFDQGGQEPEPQPDYIKSINYTLEDNGQTANFEIVMVLGEAKQVKYKLAINGTRERENHGNLENFAHNDYPESNLWNYNAGENIIGKSVDDLWEEPYFGIADITLKNENDEIIDEETSYIMNDTRGVTDNELRDFGWEGSSEDLLIKYSPVLKLDINYSDVIDGTLADQPPKNIEDILRNYSILRDVDEDDPHFASIDNPSNAQLLQHNLGEGTLIDYDEPFDGSGQWMDFVKDISSTIYGRVLQDRITLDNHHDLPVIILQYWLPYYFNFLDKFSDAIGNHGNYHEGEPENISIVLSEHEGSLKPVYCAYSKHYYGSYLQWDYVSKYMNGNKLTDHPIVYVANGSHASFFSTRYDEPTHALLAIDYILHQGKSDWFGFVDCVNNGELASLQTFKLELIPNINNLDEDDNFNWLKYIGLNGGTTDGYTPSFPFYPYMRCPNHVDHPPYYDDPGRWIHPGEWIEDRCHNYSTRGFDSGNELSPLYNYQYDAENKLYNFNNVHVKKHNFLSILPDDVNGILWFYENRQGALVYLAEINMNINNYCSFQIPESDINCIFNIYLCDAKLTYHEKVDYNRTSDYFRVRSFPVNLPKKDFCDPIINLAGWLFQNGQHILDYICPVYCYIVDSEGQRSGYLENGDFVNEIPGVEVNKYPTYNAEGDSMTTFLIPINLAYTIEAYGYAEGTSSITILVPTEFGARIFSLDSAAVTENSHAMMIFDPNGDEAVLENDTNGDGEPDQIIEAELVVHNIPEEMLEDLIEDINDLVDAGQLNPNQAQFLLTDLNRALTCLENDQIRYVISYLNSFMRRVATLVWWGVLSHEQGEEFVDAAQVILDELTGGGEGASLGELLLQIEQILPEYLALHEAYPNPFNSTTTIRYAIPFEMPVELTVYSILGQRVATLVDGSEAPGEHSLVWDASRLPSGMYFIRLNTFGQVFTRKAMLIR